MAALGVRNVGENYVSKFVRGEGERCCKMLLWS